MPNSGVIVKKVVND